MSDEAMNGIPPRSGSLPDPWVVAHAKYIAPGGLVLDLACGAGRHARYLAGLGFRVRACDIDIDSAVLQGLTSVPGIEVLAADLENAPWPFSGESFAAIVVTRYLHRPLFPHILDALGPGGILIYETFMQGHERFNRPRRPEFLLVPGELRRLAEAHGMEIIAGGEGERPGPAVMQSICARRR